MIFSFKALLITLIFYSTCFASEGEVNITNIVIQKDFIAVDVFDVVNTKITCGLLENEIQNCSSYNVSELKLIIDAAKYTETVDIESTSPQKVMFSNLAANHTYYLYCYSSQNENESKKICDIKKEITTYLYRTPIPIITFIPPLTSEVIININPQLLHGDVYCDKYHYGIPPKYPVWVSQLTEGYENLTEAKVQMLTLAEIKIENLEALNRISYNKTYGKKELIQGTKYNMFCFGKNDGYYSDFYSANFSTKPGIPSNVKDIPESRSAKLIWNYPKDYNSSRTYYKIIEFRIEIHNETWNITFNYTIPSDKEPPTTDGFIYEIKGLRPGTRYDYSIYAVDNNEEFPEENENDDDDLVGTIYNTDIYRISDPATSSFTTLTSSPDKMFLYITNIEARKANGSWEKPYDGGSEITKYHIWISTDESLSKEDNYKEISEMELYYIFKDLRPATVYYVSIRAVNKIYNGEWSTEIYEFETLPDRPDPLTYPTISWENKEYLKFEWNDGSNNGDSISNYTICPVIVRNTNEINLPCVYKPKGSNDEETSYLYNTIELQVGDIVRYMIAATNDYGTSDDSILSEQFYYDIPDEYIKSHLKCDNNKDSETEIGLSFGRHDDTLNKPKITYYKISYKANSFTEIKYENISYNPSLITVYFQVTGLVAGDDVIFTMSVCNDLGCNTPIEKECKTKPGKPDPPEFDLDSYYEPLEHKLNWSEPFHTGGLELIGYIINIYEGENRNYYPKTTNKTQLSLVIKDLGDNRFPLKKNTLYCYSMQSQNTLYQSEKSEEKCGKTAPSRPEPVINPDYLSLENNNPIILEINPEWNGGEVNRTIKIYYKTTPYYGYFEYQEVTFETNNKYYELKIDLEVGKTYQILVLAYNECPEAELKYGNKKLCGWSDIPSKVYEVTTGKTRPDRIREIYHIYDGDYTKGTVIFSEPDDNQGTINYYTFYICDYTNITSNDICEYNYTFRIETDEIFDYKDEIGYKYFNFTGLNNTQHKLVLSSTNKIGESLKSLESIEYKDRKRVTDKPESTITVESDISSTCGIVKVDVTSYPVDANVFILFSKNTETNEIKVVTQNYTSSFEYDLSSNSLLLNGSFIFFVSSCNSSGCTDFSLASNEVKCEIIPTTEEPTTTTEEPTTTPEEIILNMPPMIIINSITFDKEESIIIEFNIPEFDPLTMSLTNYSLFYYTNNNQEDKKELLLSQNYTEVPKNITLTPVEYGVFYIFESFMENETERTISLYNISEIIVTVPTKPTDLNVNNNNHEFTWKNGNPRGSNIINNTIIIEPETGYICDSNNNNNYEIVLLPSILSYDLSCYVSDEYNITIYSTNSIGKSEINTLYNYKPNIQLECNISIDSVTVVPNTTFITLFWDTSSCNSDIYSYTIIRYKLHNTDQEYTEIETTNNNKYIISYLLPFTFYEIKISYAYTVSGVEFETDNITRIVQTLSSSSSDVVNSLSNIPSVITIDNGFRIQFGKPINENYTIYVRINYTEGDTNQIIEEIKSDMITCEAIDLYQSNCYYDYNNIGEDSYMNWYEFGILSDERNNNNNSRLLLDISSNNNNIKFSQKYTLNNNFPLISYNPIIIQKDTDIISYPVINTTLFYRKINNNNNDNSSDKFEIDKKTGVITANDVITEENGSFDIEYCYLTKCNTTTIKYQIYDHLCYIEYNINPLIFIINQYNSYIPTITGGKPNNISIIPNNDLPPGIIFSNNNVGEISGTYVVDTPLVRYYNVSCSTSGGETFTPITLVVYPNTDPLPTPSPSESSDENVVNNYYNSDKNYLLLHYPLPILIDGFISNRTKIALDIWRYNETLDLSFMNILTECPFSLTSQTSNIYLMSSSSSNNDNNQILKSINCRIDNNQIIFDNFTVVNGNGLYLPFIIESKKYSNIDPLPVYLTVWSNTSSVINKDTMIIPDDYIVGGNGSYCAAYVDGCGICEGVELSCLLRLKMNILLYNTSDLSSKDIYLLEKELNDKLNDILNEKYHNISTECEIPSYSYNNLYYNFSLRCDIQRRDNKPSELVLSQIRYEIYKLIHNPYSSFYNNNSDNSLTYINDQSTPSTEVFVPIPGNDFCEIYEDKSNSRGDCNYTVDESIVKKSESNKGEGFPTWAWVLILILLLLFLLFVIMAIILYYKHLNEVKRSKTMIQKSFAAIDQMKTVHSPIRSNKNNTNATSVALPIPSITEMRNRVNIIQGYIEIYLNMKSWRRFYMVLVDAPYEILVYNSCQITSQGNVFVEIQEYISLVDIQNLECPAHGIKNNNNDIYGIPHYSAKSSNTFTFIFRCKNILEKSKWLEVLNCIKSNNEIPSGIIGYGERSTVNPVGVNYTIQSVQSSQLATIPNQNNSDDINVVPNTYFLRTTTKSKDSDDSITTPRRHGLSLTNKRSLSNNQFLPPQIPPKIQPNKKYVVSNDTELPSYYHNNNRSKNRSVSSPPRRPETRLPDTSNDVLTTDEIVEYCLRSKKY